MDRSAGWCSDKALDFYSGRIQIEQLPSPWRWMQQGPPKRCYPTTSLRGITTWRWRQHGTPKRWYSTTFLHGVTTWRWRQKVLWKASILPHRYTASQSRRRQLETFRIRNFIETR